MPPGKKQKTGKVLTQTRLTTSENRSPFKFDRDLFINRLLKWIVASGQPFPEVQHPYFRYLLESINPDLSVLGSDAVRTRIMSLGNDIKRRIKDELDSHQGKVCITADVWKSQFQQKPFMPVTVHFVNDKWELRSHGIAFKGHTAMVTRNKYNLISGIHSNKQQIFIG